LSTVSTSADLYPGSTRYAAGPYGLGQRVPMLVVSPWSTGGFVCSEVFDHTSILRFMERRFGVHEPNISPWRRSICGDLTSAFDFGKQVTKPASLPGTASYVPPDHNRHPDYVPVPPAVGSLPKQERGSRPARPLPYAPVVNGSAAPNTGQFTLAFQAGAAAGMQFYVTSANRTDGPWTYTTEAGKKISGTWDTANSQNVYDLSVFGPNGFLRTFKGPGKTAGPEATARHNASTGNLDLTLSNPGSVDCHLTVSNAYGGKPQVLKVRAGATVRFTVDLRGSSSWYDVSVVSDSDSTFLRRFAGHVETGAIGVSDPAIITG
jgi:phospholipase C